MTIVGILRFALPAVAAIATLEAVVLAVAMRRRYDWRAYGASLGDALVRQYVVTLVPLSLAAPAMDFAWNHRLFTLPLDTVTAVVVLVLLQDFSYYWFHRCSHRVRWFWATHAVHHSSNDLNLGASYRFGWTGRLSGTAIFYVPMVALGFAPWAVGIAGSLALLYQFCCTPNGSPGSARSNGCSTPRRTTASTTPPIPNISTATRRRADRVGPPVRHLRGRA